MEQKTFTLFRYRLTTGPDWTSEEWTVDASRPAVDRRLSQLNANPEGLVWSVVDLTEIPIPETVAAVLAASFLGSKHSARKTATSRENGKKGGRPKGQSILSVRLLDG